MPNTRRTVVLASIAAVSVLGAAGAVPSSPSMEMVGGSTPAQTSDSAAVVATVHAYHDALSAGDRDAAEALLAPDLYVAESGGIETRQEYLAHHLPGDIAFASAVDRVSELLRVVVEGDVAWVVARSRTTGTFRDRAVDSRGAELMVLSRTDDGWRIRAVHWSSRRGG